MSVVAKFCIFLKRCDGLWGDPAVTPSQAVPCLDGRQPRPHSHAASYLMAPKRCTCCGLRRAIWLVGAKRPTSIVTLDDVGLSWAIGK